MGRNIIKGIDNVKFKVVGSGRKRRLLRPMKFLDEEGDVNVWTHHKSWAQGRKVGSFIPVKLKDLKFKKKFNKSNPLERIILKLKK